MVQYFRLCSDSCPGLAKFEISYRWMPSSRETVDGSLVEVGLRHHRRGGGAVPRPPLRSPSRAGCPRRPRSNSERRTLERASGTRRRPHGRICTRRLSTACALWASSVTKSQVRYPGKESPQNLKYWVLQPYIGFGADAHSFDQGLRVGKRGIGRRLCREVEGGLTSIARSTAAIMQEERFFVISGSCAAFARTLRTGSATAPRSSVWRSRPVPGSRETGFDSPAAAYCYRTKFSGVHSRMIDLRSDTVTKPTPAMRAPWPRPKSATTSTAKIPP